jgi:transposase
MSSPVYTSKRLDHLGLVAGFCQEIDLSATIDKVLGTSERRQVSYGQIFTAMLLNGLGFTGRTLHMYSEFFDDKPVSRLIGEGIDASHINDDALGRCLDALYDAGVSGLYQQIAEKVVDHLKLPCEFTHLDSTSFHYDGKANSDEEEPTAIHITKGYSRDHRPELNQVVLNLICENRSGIPVYMQAQSGNVNDVEGFKKIVKSHISSLKAAQKCRYLVADAALYVKETIVELDALSQLFITRVPQKLKETKTLIQSVSLLNFESICDGYQGVWHTSHYGDVEQKWLLVRSEQATKREHHTLNSRMLKQAEGSRKTFKKLCQQAFACRTDAHAAIEQWQEKQATLAVEATVFEVPVYKGKGRPGTNQQPVRTYYQISGALYTPLEKREEATQQLGLFILATNDIKGSLSMADMLSTYKSQQAVEKGFRFLKSPDFLTSAFYVKKPERIEALLMVMTTCLMVYAALEHTIREQLEAQDEYFPDMKKKPTQTPTARWVFQCFAGIDLLTINEQQTLLLNIKDRQSVIIKILGINYQRIYS